MQLHGRVVILSRHHASPALVLTPLKIRENISAKVWVKVVVGISIMVRVMIELLSHEVLVKTKQGELT